MAQRESRRDLILETAQELFMRQGYMATSVRQIADVVGCTEAALYYHFPAGKRSLFQAALENKVPEIMQSLAPCRDAQSLPDLVQTYLRVTITELSPEDQMQLRWLITEFSHFNADEKDMIHQTLLNFHSDLRDLAQRFLPGRAEAGRFSWQLMCTVLGYIQYFQFLELGDRVEFSVSDLMREIKS